MNVGLIQLPKSSAKLLAALSQQDQNRKEEVGALMDLEDRYCGEVLAS